MRVYKGLGENVFVREAVGLALQLFFTPQALCLKVLLLLYFVLSWLCVKVLLSPPDFHLSSGLQGLHFRIVHA